MSLAAVAALRAAPHKRLLHCSSLCEEQGAASGRSFAAARLTTSSPTLPVASLTAEPGRVSSHEHFAVTATGTSPGWCRHADRRRRYYKGRGPDLAKRTEYQHFCFAAKAGMDCPRNRSVFERASSLLLQALLRNAAKILLVVVRMSEAFTRPCRSGCGRNRFTESVNRAVYIPGAWGPGKYLHAAWSQLLRTGRRRRSNKSHRFSL